jgi:hypothetical protein
MQCEGSSPGLLWNCLFGVISPGKKVRYKIMALEPFTHPDDFKFSLGGYRCELISYLISRQREINQVRYDPGRILQSSALVPMDSFTARR